MRAAITESEKRRVEEVAEAEAKAALLVEEFAALRAQREERGDQATSQAALLSA